MAKKGKTKLSKVKRNNQTTNKMRKQGKLKLQRHRAKVQKQRQPVKPQIEYSSDSESGEEWADMLDDEEQQYIMSRLVKQPQLLSNVPEREQEKKRRGTKRKKEDKGKVPKKVKTTVDSAESGVSDSDNEVESGSEIEEQYEKEMAERPHKKMRSLLPIKTKEGLQERTEECEETESEDEEENQPAPVQQDDSQSESDSEEKGTEETTSPESEVVTAVELLAARRDKLRHDKLRIGALCSSLLESPEKKLKNLYPILYLMEERLKDGALNLHSVRKLAALSAAEVFRDVLPDYLIRHQDYSNVKLKKDTLALYKYEKELLEFYKRYLQRLEKATAVLRPKKGDNRAIEEADVSLALVSLRCMCQLLEARPNFNYAANIAQSVLPFLDCRRARARDIVTECCTAIFKQDKKGDITLVIVRLINQLVKRRGARLNPSALDCLLTLDIRDVALDEEADIKHKKRQDEKHKKRIVNLSKKEKKRAKKLKEVERELLETQAQESEAARRRQLAEVARTVFHVYFRLLKSAPSSPLLAAALNGLAKFTHVINVEYYSDLVAILTRLLSDDAVSLRERLLCVKTVLSVLADAGDVLNLDPAVFHKQLYCDALNVHAGASHSESRTVIEAAWRLAARARGVSPAVLQAFAKRLATLATQSLHNTALAALLILHHLIQRSKAVSSLLETDETAGSGRFDPLLPSPEHCNAHASVLHELCALRGHHHAAVRAAAAALLQRGPMLHELNKLSPVQVFDSYDGTQMAFKPSIPPPRAHQTTKLSQTWIQNDFRQYCENVERQIEMKIGDTVT